MSDLPALAQTALRLSLFGIVTAGLIALTQQVTEAPIAKAQAASEARLIADILPYSLQGLEIDVQRLALPEAQSLLLQEDSKGWLVFAGEQESPRMIILPWRSTSGYSGDIKGIMGLLPNGQITGVRITQHRETPGLGDVVDHRKSDWLVAFTGLRLLDMGPSGWQVKKDGGAFDQITGATITPRAVVRAVHSALEYAEHFHPTLFGASHES